MLNAIFSNNLAISWQPVLVVEEAGLPGETTDHGQVTGQFFSLAAASRVHPSCLEEKQQNRLWLDPIWAQTHNLPQLRRAR